MDKNKLVLPICIIVGSIVLGGFYYMSELNKQESIERQQQIELQAKKDEFEMKSEQDKKEYVVKRKSDCYEIENTERKKFNNVDGSYYDEENDVCNVRYVNPKWKEGAPGTCDLFEETIESSCTINHYFTNEF